MLWSNRFERQGQNSFDLWIHTNRGCINNQFVFFQNRWSKLLISDVILRAFTRNICMMNLVLFQNKFHRFGRSPCTQYQSIFMSGSSLERSDFSKPMTSVLNPTNFPFTILIQLQAPVFLTNSFFSSKNGKTDSLYGIVTFNPSSSA